jgi:hypothetical protein
MNRRLWHVAGLLAFAGGCATGGPRQPYADNPLLMSREPLAKPMGPQAAKAPSAPDLQPVAKSWSNRSGPPAAPPRPASALVIDQPPSAPVLGTLTQYSPPAPKPPALPEPPASLPAAPQTSLPPMLPTPPAPVMQVSAPAPLPPTVARERYARAGDYSWLQGDFDTHYRGHKELRYAPPGDDDAYGGKVRFMDDPRLAEFQPGDLIRVEGELARDEAPLGQFPRFLVRSVRLVERRGGGQRGQ